MAPKMFDKINWDDVVKATQGVKGRPGYMYVTTTPDHPMGEKRPDRKKRYIYLHRAVMEKHLDRYLEPDEQVDHKDGDKTNNELSNLTLKKKGPHQKDHALNGNSFWKKSPRNKSGRKGDSKRKHKKAAMREAAQRVVLSYLHDFLVQ